jgi:hypothetical protein
MGRKLTTGLVLALALVTQAAKECSTPPPTKQEQRQHDGRKPAPTGCKGQIVSRVYDKASKTFAITYKDANCEPSKIEVITEEQELNARCLEGNYFPQCLKWWETEGPGVRQPSNE